MSNFMLRNHPDHNIDPGHQGLQHARKKYKCCHLKCDAVDNVGVQVLAVLLTNWMNTLGIPVSLTSPPSLIVR